MAGRVLGVHDTGSDSQGSRECTAESSARRGPGLPVRKMGRSGGPAAPVQRVHQAGEEGALLRISIVKEGRPEAGVHAPPCLHFLHLHASAKGPSCLPQARQTGWGSARGKGGVNGQRTRLAEAPA